VPQIVAFNLLLDNKNRH